MNIAFLDVKTIGEVANLRELERYGNVTYYQNTNWNEVLERIKDKEIVITNKVVLDRDIIEQASNLQLICVAATGMNNVDLEAARERNIPVKNVKGYSTHSVAQTTIAIILELLTRISYYDGYVKEGKYSRSDIFTHFGRPFWQLNGKRLGIIGLGTIGKEVAHICEGFGMEIVYFSASGKSRHDYYQRLSLHDLLTTSDIVAVHAPLNEHTEHLITAGQLKKMKKHALLINTGRGGIINETDLAQALDNHWIGGAGIDVFENEPLPADNPLLNVHNSELLVLTPHMAWTSVESRELLLDKVCDNINNFLNPSA